MEPAPSQHLIHTEGDEITHESGPLWGQGCQGQGHPRVRTIPRSRPVDPNTRTEFIGYGHRVQPMRLPPAALCCSIREHPQLCQQTGKNSCLFHEQICERQDSLSNLRDRPQQTDICLKTAFHRDLQKCKTISLFSLFFWFGKQLYFLKNVFFLLTMGLLHHLHKQSSLRSSIIVNTKGGFWSQKAGEQWAHSPGRLVWSPAPQEGRTGWCGQASADRARWARRPSGHTEQLRGR